MLDMTVHNYEVRMACGGIVEGWFGEYVCHICNIGDCSLLSGIRQLYVIMIFDDL